MSGCALIRGACAFILVASFVARPAGAQSEPNIELPLPVCTPAADVFIARVENIKSWANEAIGDVKNRKLFAKLRTVASRRPSAPAWASRTEPWSDTGDYTVHFAVGKVSDFTRPVAALTEAERRATAAVRAVATGAKAFVLDWYINDEGVAFALAGAIEAAEAAAAVAPPAAPTPAETPPAVPSPAEEPELSSQETPAP